VIYIRIYIHTYTSVHETIFVSTKTLSFSNQQDKYQYIITYKHIHIYSSIRVTILTCFNNNFNHPTNKIYTNTYLHIYVYIYMYIYTYIYTYICSCNYLRLYNFFNLFILQPIRFRSIYNYIHICIYVHIFIYVYIYIYMYICTYIYVHLFV
jgi:hypothetical protein